MDTLLLRGISRLDSSRFPLIISPAYESNNFGKGWGFRSRRGRSRQPADQGKLKEIRVAPRAELKVPADHISCHNRASQVRLMVGHEDLIQAVVRQQVLGDLPFGEALQAGRIGLWRAILGFDPSRGLSGVLA